MAGRAEASRGLVAGGAGGAVICRHGLGFRCRLAGSVQRLYLIRQAARDPGADGAIPAFTARELGVPWFPGFVFSGFAVVMDHGADWDEGFRRRVDQLRRPGARLHRAKSGVHPLRGRADLSGLSAHPRAEFRMGAGAGRARGPVPDQRDIRGAEPDRSGDGAGAAGGSGDGALPLDDIGRTRLCHHRGCRGGLCRFPADPEADFRHRHRGAGLSHGSEDHLRGRAVRFLDHGARHHRESAGDRQRYRIGPRELCPGGAKARFAPSPDHQSA